ncbi:MAG: DNA polymerase I [Erysipelotrichaceae bacterium]|nr:DNA polymerase I [Erysipelotrichaceae bacterium]
MKILLIDGNSVLFRAYYATAYGNIMKTTFGAYTNAVYAFANMLNKALAITNPDYCCVAFDKGKATFRHQMTPDYKAGRKETPKELIEQFQTVREMLTAYNIKYLEYDEIEADDIIGTLAKKFDIETCIFSSDHDLYQLIDNTTTMYCMKKGMSDIARLDEAGLMEEMGLKPYQVIDYKGLAGDSADNIKGVDGVGDKTAVKLLQQYDTCEGIYEHIDEIKGKLKEKLINGKESCFLSKKLATILTTGDVPVELEDIKLNINEETKNAFFEKYEMRSLMTSTKKTAKEPKIQGKKVSKLSKEMFDNPYIYFVSNDFSYYERNLYAICFNNGKSMEYIDIDDFRKDEEAVKFLASDNKKAVYGLKDIKHQLDFNGLSIGENTDDILLMCFLLNNNHNELPKIARDYGFVLSRVLKDVFGTEKKPKDFDEVEVMSYTYEVTDVLYQIYQKALNKLNEDEMYDLYRDIELPLCYVLYEMEKEGIVCDEEELNKIATETLKKIESLKELIYKEAGESFNINSPAQLKDILFNKLDLPDLKKGSTDAEVLNKLSDYHPIINYVLDYRKYSKLYSTYAEGLKKYIQKDGKIHSIFSQTVTATGRLSSSEPNLQNISVRDEEAKEIRKAFKPLLNSYILSSDYSQIELRVLAALANEEKMIEAFNSGIDIHTKTAMDVFKLDIDEVTPLVRRQAKAVNFGVVYGISDYGLANQTNMSFGKAKKFIEDYFITYPSIKEYLDGQVAFCKENGYVKTMLNRRRYIEEIKSSNWNLREFGKRAAMNSTIQGSAADLIKIAMINVNKEIKKNNLKSRLILQIHDELVFNVVEEELETMKKLVEECMVNAYKLNVKLDVSLSVGKDMYEAK